MRAAQSSGVPMSPIASQSWATTSSGTNDVAAMAASQSWAWERSG